MYNCNCWHCISYHRISTVGLQCCLLNDTAKPNMTELPYCKCYAMTDCLMIQFCFLETWKWDTVCWISFHYHNCFYFLHLFLYKWYGGMRIVCLCQLQCIKRKPEQVKTSHESLFQCTGAVINVQHHLKTWVSSKRPLHDWSGHPQARHLTKFSH